MCKEDVEERYDLVFFGVLLVSLADFKKLIFSQGSNLRLGAYGGSRISSSSAFNIQRSTCVKRSRLMGLRYDGI